MSDPTQEHLAQDAARLAANFDDKVPDGPEAMGHPHMAPDNPHPTPENVDITNDLDVILDDDGNFILTVLSSTEVEVSFNAAIRAAAYIVVLADHSGQRHQFDAVMEAIANTLG